jgi:hypothetical protein
VNIFNLGVPPSHPFRHKRDEWFTDGFPILGSSQFPRQETGGVHSWTIRGTKNSNTRRQEDERPYFDQDSLIRPNTDALDGPRFRGSTMKGGNTGASPCSQ